jgi:hypothetical protein
MEGLPVHLDARLGRCVYSGPEGRSYAVPGPGSICFIATGRRSVPFGGRRQPRLPQNGPRVRMWHER